MRTTLLLIPASLLIACATTGKAKQAEEEDDYVEPVQTFEEDGFQKVTLDLNQDRNPDVINFYRSGEGEQRIRLVRKQIDLNFDGKYDVTQIWKDGELKQEQIDADFDEKPDWTDYYDGGQRIRAEWDTRYDGKTDLWKYYEEGVIARVEMDTTNDGRVDYWEYYEEGSLQRSGWDLNADGKIDQWSQ